MRSIIWLFLSVFTLISAEAMNRGVPSPVEGEGIQYYSCNYHLMPIGSLISEYPVDRNGFDFQQAFLSLVPKIQSQTDIFALSEVIIQKRLEIAQMHGTYYAKQMLDLGKSRLNGTTTEDCISYGIYGSMRNETILHFFSRYLGPPSEIRKGVDFSPFSGTPGFQPVPANQSVRIWNIRGRHGVFQVFSPGSDRFYFQHPRATDVPGRVREAEALWKEVLDPNLSTLDRVTALAEFEWLWYLTNPYGRSGALTGDILSLIAQNRMVREGRKILVRKDYHTQDLEALI